MSTVDKLSLNRDPKYRDAVKKLNELQNQLSTREQEREGVLAKLATPLSRKFQLEKEATAMLNGRTIEDINNKNLLTTLEEIDHQIAVGKMAVAMQKNTIEDLRTEVSRLICDDTWPEHKANVRAIVQAGLVLAEAVKKERGLLHRLNMNDVRFSAKMRPMCLADFDLQDAYGPFARYLWEAYENKFISRDEIPAGLPKT